MFDVYVQYSNSEGFGMPQLEAAACGVPVMAVDYSAMTDAVRKLRGGSIPLTAMSVELETGCFRAIPNNEEFIQMLLRFFKLSDTERTKLGKEAVAAYNHHYGWDKTAKKWMEYFNTVDIDYYEKLWRQPPRIIEMPDSIPNGLNNIQFARWVIMTFLKDPRFINSYMEARLIRDLNYGVTTPGLAGMYFNDDSASPMFHKPNWQEFDRETAVGHFSELAKRHNMWEQRRWQSLQNK